MQKQNTNVHKSLSEIKKRKYDEISKLIEEFNTLGTPKGRKLHLSETRPANALDVLMANSRAAVAYKSQPLDQNKMHQSSHNQRRRKNS
jgi:hypothetical protein